MHFLVKTTNTDEVEYLVEAQTTEEAADAVGSGDQRAELASAWLDGDFTVDAVEKPTPRGLAAWQKANPIQPASLRPGLYFLWIEGCVEPELHGPFVNEAARLAKAQTEWKASGGPYHGIFRLNVDAKGIPAVGVFTNVEMEDDAEEVP